MDKNKPISNKSAVLTEMEADQFIRDRSGSQLYSERFDMVWDGTKIICDRCGNWQYVPTLTVEKSRDTLVEIGWTQENGQDVCPICANKSKE